MSITCSIIDRPIINRLDIEVIHGCLPKYALDIIDNSDLDENFDWKNCDTTVVASVDCKYVGLVSYGKFNNTQDGKVYPRFLHIIITPEFKRTRSAYNMLKESERVLKSEGYDTVLCFISSNLPGRDMKKRYAQKFGYKRYSSNESGEYFFKII